MLEHALPEAKMPYVPGGSFFPVEEQNNDARSSYSGQSDADMVAALTRLGGILQREL